MAMSTEIFTARVGHYNVGQERFYKAAVLFGKKTVFRTDEQPTAERAKSLVLDWAELYGKKVSWEDNLGGGIQDISAARMDEEPDAARQTAVTHDSGGGAPISPLEPQGSSSTALNRATAKSEGLSLAEERDLALCESRIREGLEAAQDARKSLLEISERRLYRAQFGTFEEYCEKRWAFSARRGWQFIAWADVEKDLVSAPGPAPAALPSTESQARPLTSVEPEKRREVWDQAVASAPAGKVTAKHVQAAVRKHKGEPLEYEVDFKRMQDGGDIERAHLHHLFEDKVAAAGSGSWELWKTENPKYIAATVIKLRHAFEFEHCEYVVAVMRFRVGEITCEAHKLQPDNGMYEGPKEAKDGELHGRLVLWRECRWRLGPVTLFRATRPKETPELGLEVQAVAKPLDRVEHIQRLSTYVITKVAELQGLIDFRQDPASDVHLQGALTHLRAVERRYHNGAPKSETLAPAGTRPKPKAKKKVSAAASARLGAAAKARWAKARAGLKPAARKRNPRNRD